MACPTHGYRSISRVRAFNVALMASSPAIATCSIVFPYQLSRLQRFEGGEPQSFVMLRLPTHFPSGAR